jgi:hypothetical protein
MAASRHDWRPFRSSDSVKGGSMQQEVHQSAFHAERGLVLDEHHGAGPRGTQLPSGGWPCEPVC